MRPRGTPAKPATVRAFKVLWYEVPSARHLFDAGAQLHRHLPVAKPKRHRTLKVDARTIDGARRAARELVSNLGGQVMSVNCMAQPQDHIVIYTRET